MALREMRAKLSIAVGTKDNPQSFNDGHSGTLVTGNKSFDIPPRFDIESFKISALSRQSEQLNFQFNETFNTETIRERQVPTLQDYYDRAFSQTDPLGARNNSRFGFDEPFVLREIGDRWGPGGAGVIDFGLVRAGIVTQASRTAADVIRLGKFAITPKGVAFALKQTVLQKMNAGGDFNLVNPPVRQRGPNGIPQADTDIRTWRPTSIIDSLPIGFHSYRHKSLQGSPTLILINKASDLVEDIGDGTVKLLGDIKDKYPSVMADVKSNLGDLKTGLANVLKNNIPTPKFTFGDKSSLTSNFPTLVSLPSIVTPNFSGFQNILGGLSSEIGSLIANAATAAAGALGGIKLPKVSLPPLPNLKLPKLPNIKIPSVAVNAFTGISQAAKFVFPELPKFSGTGGLGIGASLGGDFNRSMSELKTMVSNPSFHYELKQDDGEAQPGVLTNIYNKDFKYNNAKEFGKGVRFGLGSEIEIEGDFFEGVPDRYFPTALQAGFKFEDGRTTKVTPLNVNVIPKSINGSIPNVKAESKDKIGKRLDKYNLSSYGQLSQEDSYEIKLENADIKRGIGNYGGPSRISIDESGNVVKVSGGGTGYVNELKDRINLHPYGGTTSDININDNNIDFVPLKFRDMVNGKWMIFRAILESVADTSSPEYAEERYIGRPDKVYVYQGATRNVNVTFKVMPKSVEELVTLWDKLNYLRGLNYPKIENNRMVSPFFSFTLGDMFKNQPMIFQSLNYAIDTQSVWEVKEGMRLPKLINVSADMRLIEDSVPQATGKHYGLYWLEKDLEYGTFDRDPALPDVISPDRSTPGPNGSNWKSLFDELEVLGGIDPDIVEELRNQTQDLERKRAELDALKSDVNVVNGDIAKGVSEIVELARN